MVVNLVNFKSMRGIGTTMPCYLVSSSTWPRTHGHHIVVDTVSVIQLFGYLAVSDSIGLLLQTHMCLEFNDP